MVTCTCAEVLDFQYKTQIFHCKCGRSWNRDGTPRDTWGPTPQSPGVWVCSVDRKIQGACAYTQDSKPGDFLSGHGVLWTRVADLPSAPPLTDSQKLAVVESKLQTVRDFVNGGCNYYSWELVKKAVGL